MEHRNYLVVRLKYEKIIVAPSNKMINTTILVNSLLW